MSVDLRACKPGDKLEMPNGEVAEYVNYTGYRLCPHSVKMPSGKDVFFTDNGQFYSYRTSDIDIVKVIPMPTDSTIPQRGTKDFTKYAISVMMAYDRGEEVQYKEFSGAWWAFTTSPNWDWGTSDYRIKPKPTVVPWTRDTCPVGAVVKMKVSGDRSTIECASTCLVVIGGVMAAITYDGILSNFTMDDGAPCGTVQP